MHEGRLDNRLVVYSLLILILLFGLALRLYHLDRQSIWLDESYSIYHSQQSIHHILTMDDTAPPLYNVLLHYWMMLAGDDIHGARLLSVLFGVLTIFLCFILCRRMFDARIALLCSLFIAISPLHIYFSQEARNYSLLFALSLFSMYFYYRILMRDPGTAQSPWDIAGYIASCVLMVYTHLFGILIIAAQNAYILVHNRAFWHPSFKKWIIMDLCILVMFLPWLMRIPSALATNYLSWIERPSGVQLIYMAYNFFSGIVISDFGLILALVLLSVISFSLIRTRGRQKLLWMWIAIPIILSVSYSFFFSPVFTPKYVYYVSLPLLMLASYALMEMRYLPRVMFISSILLLSFGTLIIQDNTVTKDPWNSVVGQLSISPYHDDRVIIANSYELLSFSYYHDTGCFRTAYLPTCEAVAGVYSVDTLDEVKIINPDRVWVIISREVYNPQAQSIMDYFQKDYTLLEYHEYRLNSYDDAAEKLFLSMQQNSTLRYNTIKLAYFVKGKPQDIALRG